MATSPLLGVTYKTVKDVILYEENTRKFMDYVRKCIRINEAVEGGAYWDDHLQVVVCLLRLGTYEARMEISGLPFCDRQMKLYAESVATELLRLAFRAHIAVVRNEVQE